MAKTMVFVVYVLVSWAVLVSMIVCLFEKRYRRSVACSFVIGAAPLLVFPVAMPREFLHPMGLAVGGIALLAVAFGAGVVSSIFYTVRGEPRDRESGKCKNCDYNLTGNVSGICPECGAKCVIDEGGAAS